MSARRLVYVGMASDIISAWQLAHVGLASGLMSAGRLLQLSGEKSIIAAEVWK